MLTLTLTMLLLDLPLGTVSDTINTSVNPQGEVTSEGIYVFTKRNLFFWDHKTKTLKNLASGYQTLDLVQLEDFTVCSVFKSHKDNYFTGTFIYKNRKLIKTSETKFSLNMNVIDNRLYMGLLNSNISGADRFPYLANPVEIIDSENPIKLTGKGFAKVNRIQASLAYNWRRLWLRKKGDLVYGVNQLESAIYRYTPVDILAEQKEGIKNPTRIPSSTVYLPFWLPKPKRPFYTEAKGEERMRQKYEWWDNLGLITGYWIEQDHHVIAYHIKSEVARFDTAVAVFDENFDLVRWDRYPVEPGEFGWQPMGILGWHDGEMYVLRTEYLSPQDENKVQDIQFYIDRLKMSEIPTWKGSQ